MIFERIILDDQGLEIRARVIGSFGFACFESGPFELEIFEVRLDHVPFDESDREILLAKGARMLGLVLVGKDQRLGLFGGGAGG